MRLTRRRVMLLGGGLAAGLVVPAVPRAAETVTIRMRGDASGAHVGFDPAGVRLRPGDSVRWVNVDAGNAHTATAYHPANFGRPRRILLCVLIDRGGRELPIQADIVGHKTTAGPGDRVDVLVAELDGRDAVELVRP